MITELFKYLRFTLRVLLHLMPPWFILHYLFGTFNPGTAILMVMFLFFAGIFILKGVTQKKYHLLIGPCLTIGALFVVFKGGADSMGQVMDFTSSEARRITAQCNIYKYCVAPREWESVGNNRYYMGIPGFVSYGVTLELYNGEWVADVGCQEQQKKKTFEAYSNFRLSWRMPDFTNSTYGGVGKIPKEVTED